MDESGDLGFSFDKGSTEFFIITFLFAKSKRRLEKIAREIHGGLRRLHKHVGVLHAHNEKQPTRNRLLKKLAGTDAKIMAIVLNKRKVYTRLQDEKAVLYNYVVNILLDRLVNKGVLPSDDGVTLIASKRETNKFLNENFKDYLTRQVGLKVGIRVEIATPDDEKSLQVADFASWAIFRKHEHGDSSYRDIIANLIIEEAPLFP